VLQQKALAEACDNHYCIMTGQHLYELLSVKSAHLDQALPGVRGGMAPYVTSVVKRKQKWEEHMQYIPPVVHCGDREEVCMCAIC